MRWRTIILSALLGLVLVGCEATALLPYAHELEDMSLMRTMGVDVGARDGVQVTASSGVQRGGREQDSQPPVVVTGEGLSLSAACLTMQRAGEGHVFYGHVGQMLLGETLAKQGVAPALDYVLRDVELRLDTQLFVVQGAAAGEAIRQAAGEDSSAADKLDGMERDEDVRSQTVPRTVRQVLSDLARNGCSFVPAITGQGGLGAAGYAVLKDGALAGWVTGDGASGMNLLLGKVEADVVEVTVGGQVAALRVVGAKTGITPQFQNGALTGITLHCAVDANLAEAEPGLNLRQRAVLEACTQALAAIEQGRIEAALAVAQTLGADFLDLEKRAGLAAPWLWAGVQAQWDISTLPVTVTVEVRVLRSYDVER